MPNPLRLRPADDYIVRLDVFEGPMDLLLHLIEKEELPITAISLAQVTAQYLSYLSALEVRKPDGIADFLVMAARLLYVKSVALLPRPEVPAEEEEEDPGEALARQLRAYKRFKEKAAFLADLEARGQRSYVRIASLPKLEKRLDLGDLDLEALVAALHEALQDFDAPPSPEGVVHPYVISIGDKIKEIRQRLASGQRLRFSQFLTQARSRIEIIVSFMAVLEIGRAHV